MKHGMQVGLGLGPGHIVLDGNPAPPPSEAQPPPNFRPISVAANGCMDQDASWYGDRPETRRLCVRWGPRSPFSKRGQSPPPQFSAHFCCGQTAGCTKMPLGTELGLSPGDCVRWGPSPYPKVPNFRPISTVTKRLTPGCIKMPLGMEVGLSPGDFVFDGGPGPLPKSKRGWSPPNFRLMSIVAKWLDWSRWHLAWMGALVQATLC